MDGEIFGERENSSGRGEFQTAAHEHFIVAFFEHESMRRVVIAGKVFGGYEYFQRLLFFAVKLFGLGKAAEAVSGLVERAFRRLDIDEKGSFASDAARIFDRAFDAQSFAVEEAARLALEFGIGKPVTEQKRGLLTERGEVAVADVLLFFIIDARARVAGVVRIYRRIFVQIDEVMRRGQVVIVERPTVGKPARRADVAAENVREALGAALTAETRPEHGFYAAL